MKVGGEKIARCAICGGWPKAVVTMDAHASAHCECMRCGRRGPTITAGVNEFDAPTLARAAAQAWNLPLNLDPELLVAALMHNGAARETVRQLRLSAAAAAHAYDAALNELPDRLLLAAGAGEPPPARHMKPHRQMEPRRHSVALRRLLPLAATLAALAIGLAGGYELRALGVGVAGPERAEGYAPAAAPPADLLAAAFESALLPTLDGGAEGQVFAYAGKAGERGRIELGGRFTTGFGAECREFTRSESRDGVAGRAGGVACRGADRSWNVLLLPVAGS